MEIVKCVSYILYKKIVYYLPASNRNSNNFFRRIRASLVRGYIDYCGKSVNIQSRATIARRVSIGDYSGVGKNCLIQSNVTIGKHVMMGPEVIIYTQNHCFDRVDITMDQQGFAEEKKVYIEDDVWIGARVIILPGVTIGRGSVIGAGAVVSKDIPPYSVAVGNPSRIVKNRIEDF